MGYPAKPRATGDLVVGNLPTRTWAILDVGTAGQIAMVDSITNPTLGLSWTNELLGAPLSFISDLTLWDTSSKVKNMTLRMTNATGIASLSTNQANPEFYIGGHTVGEALHLSRDANEHLLEPSSVRTLRVEGAVRCTTAHVLDGETRTVPDGCDVVVVDRFDLNGTGALDLEGDATLEVL